MSGKRWAMLGALFVSLLATVALPVHACGTLKLSYHPYPGLYEPQSSGDAKGMDVDVVRELARRSGCVIQGTPGVALRTWAALVAAEVDMATAVMYLPQREAHVEYLALVRTRLMLLQRQQTAPPDLAAFESNPSLRLGVVRAAPFAPGVQRWVDKLRAQGRVSESADMLSLLKAFDAGRTDALLIYPLALQSQSEAWLAQHRMLDAWPAETVFGGMAMSRSSMSSSQRALLRQAMKSMLADGTLAQLAERHFGPSLAAHYAISERP